jgi:hypothetical protein
MSGSSLGKRRLDSYSLFADSSDDEDFELPPPPVPVPAWGPSTSNALSTAPTPEPVDSRAEAVATLEQLKAEFEAKKNPPVAQRRAEFDAKQTLLRDGTDAEAKACVFKVLTVVGWNASNTCYHLGVTRSKAKGEPFNVRAYTFADAVSVADAAERAGIESQMSEGKAKNLPTPVPSMTIELADADLRDLLMVERDSLFAYVNSPIFCKCVTLRGRYGEEVVRLALTTQGHAVKAPLACKDVNGKKRARGTETYDLRIAGKGGGKDERVEVKLARLTYDPYHHRWKVHFAGVKSQLHDRLLLVVEMPDSYRIFEWGGQNASTTGQRRECLGDDVVVAGSRGETDFAAAAETILQRMRDAGNEFVAKYSFDHEDIKATHATTTAGVDAYAASPLSVLSHCSRGTVGEAVLKRHVLDRLETYAVVAAESSLRVNGTQRGENCTEYDLGLIQSATGARKRGEVKTGRVGWNTYLEHYRVQFARVKPGLFDVLFLVLELPSGLHVLQLDAAMRVSKAGKQTEACGGKIDVSAPKDVHDLLEVETMILKKLCYMHGAKYLAFLPYAEGCTFDWAVAAVRGAK